MWKSKGQNTSLRHIVYLGTLSFEELILRSDTFCHFKKMYCLYSLEHSSKLSILNPCQKTLVQVFFLYIMLSFLTAETDPKKPNLFLLFH